MVSTHLRPGTETAVGKHERRVSGSVEVDRVGEHPIILSRCEGERRAGLDFYRIVKEGGDRMMNEFLDSLP